MSFYIPLKVSFFYYYLFVKRLFSSRIYKLCDNSINSIYLVYKSNNLYTNIQILDIQFPPNTLRGSSKILWPGSSAKLLSWTGFFDFFVDEAPTGFAIPDEKISSVNSRNSSV